MRRFFPGKGRGALQFTLSNPLSIVAPTPSFLVPPLPLIPFSSHPLLPRFLNPSLLPFFGSRPSPGTTSSWSPSSSSSVAMPGAETAGVEWPAKRVRDTFIKFFEEKNHVNWKSSPVVPLNDPTLLFANAGIILFFRDSSVTQFLFVIEFTAEDWVFVLFFFSRVY